MELSDQLYDPAALPPKKEASFPYPLTLKNLN